MKLCNRDYSDDSLLTVKQINGISCCPSCEKPTQMHHQPIEKRALYWSLSGDTGVSSEALCAHMVGSPLKTSSRPPSDASDRGRCIRLLELIPEWIPRLNELADVEVPHGELVIGSTGLSTSDNSWSKQIPLIIREGRF